MLIEQIKYVKFLLSLKFPVFQTSGGMPSRPAAFPFLVDFSAFCSSSMLNGPFLMGSS